MEKGNSEADKYFKTLSMCCNERCIRCKEFSYLDRSYCVAEQSINNICGRMANEVLTTNIFKVVLCNRCDLSLNSDYLNILTSLSENYMTRQKIYNLKRVDVTAIKV